MAICVRVPFNQTGVGKGKVFRTRIHADIFLIV
jgi:hypothetical protein